jgi:hypothetical protein
MSGYIHTCGNCGAHMQVHERYLGRTLKCTSCRTEFEAVMPEDAAPEEPTLPELPDEGSQQSAARFIPWIVLLLIPVVGLMWFLGQDQSEGPAETVFRTQRTAGSNATVDTGMDRPVLVALEYEAVGPLVTMSQGSVQINVNALMDQKRYIELPSGTSVRVLEYADKSRVARVRILQGPWQSRIVWVPARWVH